MLFTASNSSGTASQPLTLTVIQLPPATVVAAAGTPQSALINTAFATPFQVTVWDANSQPVAGATVNFAVPSSGPGGSFAGGVTTAVANTLGVATAPVFTANGTVGLYTINASVAGVATPATFSLTNTQPPFFTSAANATFAVGAQQLFPATASGFPAPAVSLASGSLPSGLVFNGGVLSGIPAPGTGGIYTLTLAATNGILPNASQTFTLMVDQGSAFTSANSATFTAGTPSSFTFTGSGFPSPTISLASGTLPNGVGFSNGALSGTPAAGTGGQYSLTLSASNGVGGAALQNFTLVVDQPPAVTSANSATFTTGVPGSFLMTATGFPAPAIGEVGTLPSGLVFNANTGVLSGTPAPDSGGSYQITLSASSGPFAPVTQPFTLIVNLAVLTQHNDNTRSGLNSSERLLTTLNVNASQFGKVFALPVDGQVYGQPLYVANVQFPGNVIHNVLIVTTENDSVYAFDADSNTGANANPLWKANLVDSGHGGGVGEAPVDTAVQNGCTDLTPQVGVTATPVINVTTAPAPTIYVEAASVLGVNYLHKIHALDITSGNEKSQGPTLISGTVPGTGDGSSDGNLSFSPASERNRSGLLLLNGVIYVAFGSYCDYTPYQGWLFAYDATSLAQRSLFVTTPNGGLGGIWAGGTGLAADQNGFLYIPTGNGTFDTTTPVTDFGDSILKFSTINNNQSNGFLSLTDYFTPYDQAFMWQNDQDLGSGGVLLLPDQPGAHPHLLVQAGKRGKVYLLDRDQMTSNPSNPLQTEPYCSACTSADTQILQESSTSYLGPVFAGPSYWNNNIYFWGVDDALTSIPLSDGLLNFSGAAKASFVSGFPGTATSISSNGNNSGTAIVWANASLGGLRLQWRECLAIALVKQPGPELSRRPWPAYKVFNPHNRKWKGIRRKRHGGRCLRPADPSHSLDRNTWPRRNAAVHNRTAWPGNLVD